MLFLNGATLCLDSYSNLFKNSVTHILLFFFKKLNFQVTLQVTYNGPNDLLFFSIHRWFFKLNFEYIKKNLDS